MVPFAAVLEAGVEPAAKLLLRRHIHLIAIPAASPEHRKAASLYVQVFLAQAIAAMLHTDNIYSINVAACHSIRQQSLSLAMSCSQIQRTLKRLARRIGLATHHFEVLKPTLILMRLSCRVLLHARSSRSMSVLGNLLIRYPASYLRRGSLRSHLQ